RGTRSLEGDAVTANEVERGGRERVAEPLGGVEAGPAFHPGQIGSRGLNDGLHGRRHLRTNAVTSDHDDRRCQGLLLPHGHILPPLPFVWTMLRPPATRYSFPWRTIVAARPLTA